MLHFLAGLVLAATLVAGPASAAPPNHSGTWKAIEAGSTWSTGDFPKGFSLVIDLAFQGDRLVYTSVNDTDKAKILHLTFTAPLDGTVMPIEGQARYNQIAVKQTGPDDLEILQLKDGDVIVGAYYTFLPDGKTFVRRGVGKASDGKSKAYQEYFKRR